MSSEVCVEIRSQVAGDKVSLVFRVHGGPTLPVPLGLTTGRLRELRQQLDRGLHGFVSILARSGQPAKNLAVATEALSRLHAIGAELGTNIFRGREIEVSNFLLAACPGWKAAGQEAYLPPRFVLFGTREHPLPLEFVPLFDSAEPDIRDVGDVLPMAARFPVFSTLFCRSPTDNPSEAAAPVIDNDPDVLLRLFVHTGLLGVREERAFLQTQPGTVVRGPWPDQSLSQDDFVRDLTGFINSASAPGDRGTDHIQHFICHCDTDRASSSDYTITLAHDAKKFGGLFSRPAPMTAALQQINVQLFGRAMGPEPGPLVFLNACGSSKVTADGVASFPGLFLDRGRPAVIGTEYAVPDLAAAAFARAFYTSFLSGQPLGRSLYDARIRMLQPAMFNPVGAIYTAYADARLALRLPTRRVDRTLGGITREVNE